MDSTQSLHSADPGGRGRWRFPVGAFIVALLLVAGVGVMSYPSVASWFSQRDQSRVVSGALSTIVDGDAAENAHELKLARAYNDALSSGAVVTSGGRIPVGRGEEASTTLAYNDMLNADPTGVMARLQIPSINLDLPIYHGSSDATLLKGLGHLEGTSLPVGGVGTHAVITGHRGLSSAVMFSHLDKVGTGDMFSISVAGQVLAYRVVRIQVVDPDQTRSLLPVAGKDLVTLVTCTPLGINSQRILVTGQRVHPTPAADVEAAHRRPDIPGFPWWAIWLSATLVAAVGYVWWSGRPRRSHAPVEDPRT